MAGHAGNPRKLRVIERRARPAIQVVAHRAIRWKLRRYVIRRFRLLVLLRVAGVAISRQSLELPGGGTLMAGIAIHHGVRAYQWKAVLVILDCTDIRLPAFDGVARFTVGAHLPAMNVCMAVGALATYIRENRLRVAGSAGHIRVHAAQRIFRLIVIELRNRANRLPSRRRVAVLARDIERRTVRAARTIARGASPCGRRSSHHGKQPKKQNT